jgi:hypothetical protein
MPDIKTTEREFAIRLIGWLARKKKITLTKDKDGKPDYASLNPGA